MDIEKLRIQVAEARAKKEAQAKAQAEHVPPGQEFRKATELAVAKAETIEHNIAKLRNALDAATTSEARTALEREIEVQTNELNATEKVIEGHQEGCRLEEELESLNAPAPASRPGTSSARLNV